MAGDPVERHERHADRAAALTVATAKGMGSVREGCCSLGSNARAQRRLERLWGRSFFVFKHQALLCIQTAGPSAGPSS